MIQLFHQNLMAAQDHVDKGVAADGVFRAETVIRCHQGLGALGSDGCLMREKDLLVDFFP